MHLNELLIFSIESHSSDLHLSSGLPPILRVDGVLKSTDFPVLSDKSLILWLYDIMNEEQRKRFEKDLDVDFSFELNDIGRFRVNIFKQNRGIAAVFRIIPTTILSLKDLGLPAIVAELSRKSQGLILVTGPTGSGKSTTLAAIVDDINTHSNHHILTVEDPIEFIHQSKNCVINQREVMRDTHSFHHALRAALREDPDVILVGELRDVETIRLALTAAETGHLVLATLHTQSATQTVHRLIDVFPAAEKAMIRTQLSGSLKAVIAQSLLKKEGGGRVAALEVMICNAALAHMIREDKVAQMYSVLQTGRSEGMFTLNQHLEELLKAGNISATTAHAYAV